MVLLVTTAKSKNTEKWINWNKSTFELRQSMGLQDVKAFKNVADKDEYLVLSWWTDQKQLESYLNNDKIQLLFKNEEIKSYKIFEPVAGETPTPKE